MSRKQVSLLILYMSQGTCPGDSRLLGYNIIQRFNGFCKGRFGFGYYQYCIGKTFGMDHVFLLQSGAELRSDHHPVYADFKNHSAADLADGAEEFHQNGETSA